MSAVFPSAEWLNGLRDKLNEDQRYHAIAKNWEGDLFFEIGPEGNLKSGITFYLDLWHGTCRKVDYLPKVESYPGVAYLLSAGYKNITEILSGKLNAMTAMMTNKLKVKGSMAYMMRNVPTVLDFVRCAREVTTTTL